MKVRYIIYTLLLLGLAYLVYYRISDNKKIAGEGGPKGGAAGKEGKGGGKGGPAISVEGIIVKTVSFDNRLEVSGSIEANESVVLRSEVAGLVTGIYFKEGSNVSKGSVLVKVNDRDIQAQLREALTKQNLSATNENRAKQLLQKGAISQEEYDTALADLQTLKAQAQLIRAQLAKTSIIAPFRGKIGLRSISVGEYLTPSTTIANLSSINPVKISFSVPEKYVGQISLNSSITFTTDASGKTYTGKVFAIEPGINQQTRTLQIKALAQNPNGELLPGAFAKIKLSLKTLDNAILIPTEAVIPVLKGKIVYISKDGKAKQVNVEAGTRTAESIVITSGLSVGDTVLTTGAMSLKPDAPVKVKLVKTKQ
ncbi:efflux RND transporter periplasmic adaptor subunit [Pedobacter frigiditerrae]|uniref:Efflux RND transporter periplasmic adaptor subunit n=1 Tax=Pedobacter frigiditerrae TaxID=2530452 RepID=A0A4R0N817_9SPHI|nr:efflux RND transporter periplasmic adaptor subunit [Pedobacter frigiditerrae]TCC94354.1 efflux RND transporter periplasmic adaptor subunit [Pedobacter frigiditerrae]